SRVPGSVHHRKGASPPRGECMLGSSMTPADPSTSAGPRLEVPPVAAQLGERFRTAGYQLYLVGGAVRELLMAHPSRGEFDFATDARPEVTLRMLQGWAESRYLQGIKFGTVGAKKGGATLEITTFRKEAYPADDRHPHVTFGERIEDD